MRYFSRLPVKSSQLLCNSCSHLTNWLEHERCENSLANSRFPTLASSFDQCFRWGVTLVWLKIWKGIHKQPTSKTIDWKSPKASIGKNWNELKKYTIIGSQSLTHSSDQATDRSSVNKLYKYIGCHYQSWCWDPFSENLCSSVRKISFVSFFHNQYFFLINSIPTLIMTKPRLMGYNYLKNTRRTSTSRAKALPYHFWPFVHLNCIINIRHISSHKMTFVGLEPQWYITTCSL
jgi:hypothetical protein